MKPNDTSVPSWAVVIAVILVLLGLLRCGVIWAACRADGHSAAYCTLLVGG